MRCLIRDERAISGGSESEPVYWKQWGHGYTKDKNEAYRYSAEASAQIAVVEGLFIEEAGSYVFRCEDCPGEPPPEESAEWRITRRGDAVTAWACNEHFMAILLRLADDRPGREVTELTVTRPKPAE